MVEGDEENKESEGSQEATRLSIRKAFGAGVIIVCPLTPGWLRNGYGKLHTGYIKVTQTDCYLAKLMQLDRLQRLRFLRSFHAAQCYILAETRFAKKKSIESISFQQHFSRIWAVILRTRHFEFQRKGQCSGYGSAKIHSI